MVVDCCYAQYYLGGGPPGGSHGCEEHDDCARFVERGKMILKIVKVGV